MSSSWFMIHVRKSTWTSQCHDKMNGAPIVDVFNKVRWIVGLMAGKVGWFPTEKGSQVGFFLFFFTRWGSFIGILRDSPEFTDGHLQFIAVRSSSCTWRCYFFEIKISQQEKPYQTSNPNLTKIGKKTITTPSSTYYDTMKATTFLVTGVLGGHDERYCKLGCAETHARCGKERALGHGHSKKGR